VATQMATDRMARPGTAAEVAKVAPLEDAARALLRPAHSPQDYIAALVKAGHLPDAIRFLANLLTRREVVWWAAQCVRQVPELAAGEKLAAALAAAETWAASPSDDHRRAAYATAEAAGLTTPAGCTAMAAFLSEGSLAPAHLQPVPPPSHAGPSAASSAVILAAVVVEPEKANEKYEQFLTLGSAVATGQNRWPGDRPAAPSAATAQRPPTNRPTSPPPPSRGWY
jgi:hypothetical protein